MASWGMSTTGTLHRPPRRPGLILGLLVLSQVGVACLWWRFGWQVGLPVMVAEMALGRQARANPITALRALAPRGQPWWLLGVAGMAAAFLILSFYSEVVAWVFAYVAKALGCATLDVSNSLHPAVRALRNNEQVLAAIDVPSDQVAASVPVQIAGMAARVPKALLRLAVEQKVPVTVYLTGINMDTGQRTLRIVPLPVLEDLDALVEAVFIHLTEALHQDSVAWHFWSESERFFVAPPDAHGGG